MFQCFIEKFSNIRNFSQITLNYKCICTQNFVDKFVVWCCVINSYTGCIKSFATFFILHISRLEKMIKSWFFFQKMQHEKLYKKYIRKYLLIDSKDFFVVIINNLYDTAMSQCDRGNKNVSKTFSFFFTNLYTRIM
jgi:hypothetical protein